MHGMPGLPATFAEYCPQVVTDQNIFTLTLAAIHTRSIIIGVSLHLSLKLSKEPKRVYVIFFSEDHSFVSSNNRQILETGLSSNPVFVFS